MGAGGYRFRCENGGVGKEWGLGGVLKGKYRAGLDLTWMNSCSGMELRWENLEVIGGWERGWRGVEGGGGGGGGGGGRWIRDER